MALQKSPHMIEIGIKVPGELQRQVQEQVSASLIELFKRLNCQIPEIRYQDKMSKPPNHKKLRRIQREFQPS